MTHDVPDVARFREENPHILRHHEVGTSRCDVPARVPAGGTRKPKVRPREHSFRHLTLRSATGTAQRASPYLGRGQRHAPVRISLIILLALTTCLCHASNLWMGPTVGFSQAPNSGQADTVLAGSVVLSRGPRDGLLNTAYGETYIFGVYPGPNSPTNTEWAFGTLDNLPPPGSFQSLESMRDGNLAFLILFQPMVMHIIKEDIYVAVTFSAWGQHTLAGFAYNRSTPSPNASITIPPSGAVFSAPANLKLAATGVMTGATITNVSFFNGANLLGSVKTAPFNLTASNLTAGSYTLTAVASAAGLSGTSAVVNVSVVNPVAVSLSRSQTTNGTFSFQYSANPGLSYVIQTSPNLVTWTSVATNIASTNPAVYSEPFAATARRYYRVARLPNP